METQDAQESTSSQPGGTSPAANHSGTQSPTATSITAFPSYGSDSRGGFSRNESAPQIHNPRLPPSSRPVPTVSRNDHTASRSSQDHVDVHERHPAPFSVATGRSSREVADIHTRPLTHRPPAQPPMNRYTTAQPVFDQGQAAYQSRRPIDQIDSGYDAFTPRGAWVQREPTWSLATTLPRVVRPGMRKTSSRTVSSQRSSNDVEASPQLAQTPGVRKSTTSRQREDRLAPQVGETPGVRRSSTQRTSTRRESEEQHRKDAELYQQGIGQGDMAPDATVEGNEDNLAGLMPLPTDATQGQYELDTIPEKRDEEEASSTYSRTDEAIPEEPDPHEDYGNIWTYWRSRLRHPLAEFLGTFVGMTIGLCGNLSVTTSNNAAGSYQSTNWAWGLGTMMGVYVAGGISGAHLNPAVSLMLCISRGFPIRRVCYYTLAQLLAAFTAGGVAFGIYKDSILHFNNGQLLPDPDNGTGGGVLYTQPKAWLSPAAAFFNEFVAATLLGIGILALGDDTNTPPGAGMHAFIIGLFTTVLSMAFGYNTNNCLNPARDLGPRLIAQFAGYGSSEVWTSNYWWWLWGPWAADLLGTVNGAFMYDFFCFMGPESPTNYPFDRWRGGLTGFTGRARRIGGKAGSTHEKADSDQS